VSESRRVPVIRWRGEDPVTGVCDPAVDDSIAVELPVALTYNRVSHVVMMATPTNLEDFAVGFSMTEGLVGDPGDILSTRVIPRSGGIELAMTITEEWFDRLATQRRNMAGRTGCGLCGAENIEQALHSPRAVSHDITVTQAALQRAVSELEPNQPLQAETGAAHGAAWCGLDGGIIRLREDVGRHNALDKLIGALMRTDTAVDAGFLVITSRCSFEMVEKAARLGAAVIVAISAPTSLALERARSYGMTLCAIARADTVTVFTGAERLTDGA